MLQRRNGEWVIILMTAKSFDGRKKEFIILGNQLGHKIASLILTK